MIGIFFAVFVAKKLEVVIKVFFELSTYPQGTRAPAFLYILVFILFSEFKSNWKSGGKERHRYTFLWLMVYLFMVNGIPFYGYHF